MNIKATIMLFTAGLLLAQTVVQPVMAQMTISGTVRYAKSGETVQAQMSYSRHPTQRKYMGSTSPVRTGHSFSNITVQPIR